MAFFSYLRGRLQAYALLALAILAAVGAAFMKGRSAGKASASKAIAKETQKLDEKFHKIDSAKPDLDGALGRLRDRSKKG